MAAPAASRLRELARGAAPRTAGEERCDLCAEPLGAAHRHLLETTSRAVVCACRACEALFDVRTAGRHYRLLPRRRLRLTGCTLDDVLWAGLGIPVDLAFLVRESASGRTAAGYPSPLGVLRSEVDPEVWREVTACHPALEDLAEDVEALLVHRARGAREHWIVPLDDCYRLVALVRAHWKGLGGGPEVWEQVERFFTDLATHEEEGP